MEGFETSLIRRYKNGQEAHFIDLYPDGQELRRVAFPEEQIVLQTSDRARFMFLRTLDELDAKEEELGLERVMSGTMFARDYRIEVMADNNDDVFWTMFRKGECAAASEEELGLVVKMLRTVLFKIETVLSDSRRKGLEERLPAVNILRELQVTRDNLHELVKLVTRNSEFEVLRCTEMDSPDIKIWLTDGNGCAVTGDWLMLGVDHHWFVMSNDYHKRMSGLGLIKMAAGDNV